MQSPMELELLDLRHFASEPLLRRAYNELYVPAFVDPDEQETLEQYCSRLFDPQPPPPHSITHFVVAGRNLERAAEAKLLGFLIFETYRGSACGFFTYMSIAPAVRRQGLGRRLFAEGRAILHREMDAWFKRRGALAAIFGELHDPAKVPAERDVFDPALRFEILGRLGAALVPIRYVQPALQPGGDRSRKLMLATLPLDGTTPRTTLPASVVRGFLHEFYRALGVSIPESDADYQTMLADLDNAVREPPQMSPVGLPYVRLTATEEPRTE